MVGEAIEDLFIPFLDLQEAMGILKDSIHGTRAILRKTNASLFTNSCHALWNRLSISVKDKIQPNIPSQQIDNYRHTNKK